MTPPLSGCCSRSSPNRALDPSSKLAAAHWAGRRAWIDGLPGTTDGACYRAMDWLHQVKDAVEKEIYCQIANLLNLEVDLLFFETTRLEAGAGAAGKNPPGSTLGLSDYGASEYGGLLPPPGDPFGAAVWAASYVVLPTAKLTAIMAERRRLSCSACLHAYSGRRDGACSAGLLRRLRAAFA